MNYKCTFSMITVCFNASSCMEKTIKSVLLQDCKDYEYLIVDGNSNDDTIERLRRYESKFNGRLRWISEPDRGLYDAMNKGIKMSKGKYLIFINADDELYEGVLGQVKTKLDNIKDNTPNIIYGDSMHVYLNAGQRTIKLRKSFPQITLKTLRQGMGVVHQSIFTHREIFERVGNFNLEFTIGADWDFLIRCVSLGISFVYLPIPVSIFPTNGISSSVHNIQRHTIRKRNHLYKMMDLNFIRDVLSIGTMLQLVIGAERYQSLRYFVNKKRK